LNESRVLSQPSIEGLFEQFVTVRLYEDRVPEGVAQAPDADAAQEFAGKQLGNYARPYYVVMTVKGKTLTKIAEYDKGIIGSSAEFAGFLNRALAAAK
jgi:hypothetical protein